MDRARTIGKWVGFALLAVVLLIGLALLGLNTGPGRRLIASQISSFKTESGLNFRVGRIDGSIYGQMTLRDVRVADPKGVFLTAPTIAVDWRPFGYLRNHVDVRNLAVPSMTLARNPQLKAVPSDPDAPILPDLDIDIDRLSIARAVIGPAVAGSTRVLNVTGAVHIADRRAQLDTKIMALSGGGIRGGDRLTLVLDAVPDDNRLVLNGRLSAPAGGALAGMLNLTKPVQVQLEGKGSWQAWNGKLLGTLGGSSLANLTLTARNGTFAVKGVTHPGLYLAGPVERLTAPGLAIDLTSKLDQRRADTRLMLRSDALAVMATGMIDLGKSRFDDVTVEARLMTPGAIAPNLVGRDVLARLALDGPFATPTIDYKVRAAMIGFGETRVENVYAEGLARVDAKRILVPLNARARRVTGLNPAIGGLLTNVSINGDIAFSGDTILSDNLKIRSDRVNATAIVLADLSSGRYTGGLNGRIDNYRIESLGVVDLETDAKLLTAPGGGFAIKGRVIAQTKLIFNEGARTFLGGNALVKTNFKVGEDGGLSFDGLRMTAPQFRITRGSGSYDPAGRILVNADAYSTVYGPLTARVTGTINEPQVQLRAPRPGVGVGLVDLDARVRGSGGAYAVTATGGTDYGPFSADVIVRPGATLNIDVRRVRFAGVNANGQIQQTRAGPFAGRLRFAGSGLTGSLLLANQNGLQRADVDARANSAKIPGTVDFTIGRAIIKASVVLADKPQIVADAQVADLRYGSFILSSARAKVNYAGGSGTAQAVASGSSSVPFQIAANARLSPRDWLIGLKGQANGIAFRSNGPLHIQPVAAGYRLLPSRIDFSKGSIRLEGDYGRGTNLRARVEGFDLSVLNAVAPSMGFGGTATGSVDFTQASSNAVPTVDARMTISNFTRASLTATSTPVDIVVASKLDASGGTLRALIRRGGVAIGRVVANLRPLGGGASWSDRLLAAPLSGGIRYSGPAGVPFSLAGLAGQQLTGPIAIAADFSGRVNAPRLNGIVRADRLTYDNENTGTRLSNLALQGRFNNDRLEIVSLQAKAGEGTVNAQGTIGLSSAAGFPIDLKAKLDNARLAKSDAFGATATGNIRITNGPGGGLIRGTLVIPEARYKIIRQGSSEVPELAGVRRKSDRKRTAATPPPAIGAFKLDLRIRADNRLFVSGMGLESEWSMDLRVAGTNLAPTVSGRLDLVRGTYSFSGKQFEVTRGIIRFQGGDLADPVIDIQASTTTNGITAIINVAGTGSRPRVSFTSSPVLPQDEVLSRLLFGSSPSNLSALEALQLASALNSLRGSGGGLNPLGKLRSAVGFDRLRILGADDATGRGSALAAGKYLTDDIYIEIVTDARGFTATQLELALTKSLSVLSQAGSFGGSNVTLRYSKDF